MGFDYYTLNSVIRLSCCVYLVFVFFRKGAGKLTKAFAWLFVGLGLSLVVFFSRNFLPPEWAQILRDIGTTSQMVALLLFSRFVHKGEFD
jgi:hypothetical protein